MSGGVVDGGSKGTCSSLGLNVLLVSLVMSLSLECRNVLGSGFCAIVCHAPIALYKPPRGCQCFEGSESKLVLHILVLRATYPDVSLFN